MLPYQAAVAMDYAGYQRQPTPGHPGSHMAATMGPLAMPAVPFSHSWMVPTQDLCAMPPYNKMPGHQQPPGPGMHAQQQPIEPGLVRRFLRLKKIYKFWCLYRRIETFFKYNNFNYFQTGNTIFNYFQTGNQQFQKMIPFQLGYPVSKISQNQRCKIIIGKHSRYFQIVPLNK